MNGWDRTTISHVSHSGTATTDSLASAVYLRVALVPTTAHHGYLVLYPACWYVGDDSHFMSWRSRFLFHQHRRSVHLSDVWPHSRGLIASMFCKSCNCNSSIATRIGFAASCCNSPPCIRSNPCDLDYIHTQLPFGMAHENTVRHTQDRGMELRLHQDGV